MTALVVCGVAVPNAAARVIDVRTPDTRDAAIAASATLSTSDLRSADARAATPDPAVRANVDLRSPDARAVELAPGRATVASVPVTPQRIVEASGFDWTDFGIGVGAAMAMVLLGLGAVTLSHQRGRTGGSGPSPLAS